MNRLVIFLARTPLHWLVGPSTTVVSYTAPKSGRPVELPVWALEHGVGWIVVVGGHEGKTWWKAFRRPLAATLQSGARSRSVQGQLLDGPAREAALTAYLKRVPMARRSTSAEAPVVQFLPAPAPAA